MISEAPSASPGFIRSALDALWMSRTTHAASWNALGVFAVRALSAALLFLTQVVLARWMGASEYGLYVTAWTCVLVLGGLAHLGFNVAMMRLAPQYHANGDYASFRGLLNGGRRVALVSSAVIATVGLTTIWAFHIESKAALALPLVLGFLCLPFYALTDVQDGFGRGQGWTMEAIIPPYVVRPLMLLLLVASVFLASLSASAVTGMTLALVAVVVAMALQTILMQRRVAASVPHVAPAYHFADWFRISLPLLAGGICEIVIQNADVLLLNFFRPSDEIGHYYAAAKTTGLVLFILYAVGTAYAGRIAAAHTLGNRAEIESLVGDAVRWTFLPAAAIMIGILAVGYPVLTQFGDTFTDAYPLMFILAAGILTKAAMGPSETILNMLGHQRASALSLGIAAAVAVTLNLVLIPLWGVTGAAVATATAFATMALINWLALRKLEGLNLFILANLPRSNDQR
ncbi:lipopolysaccharide biosynthesis protein [Hyphomicrobium sp.]|uniref:lipopolysaccharide biosynthesis protein n=1 Tax=Hyphomicrobium sp. TaxID=82 RepID=UPI0025C13DA5|nr:lipopolysaccharide biosynthesis protein [Hyphomicrobium sp.]MCC7250631.1 lipopolysaccharide biosynthesis protein [Hyphomicrobium sp.]